MNKEAHTISSRGNNNNNNHIYNIYIEYIQTQLTLKPVPTMINCPSGLWDEFLNVVRRQNPKGSRSAVLRDLIAEFCLKNHDNGQCKINVFINKPEVVTIQPSKVTVESKPKPDYSTMSQDCLVSEYLKADSVKRQIILFELKKRGVNIRDFQRRNE